MTYADTLATSTNLGDRSLALTVYDGNFTSPGVTATVDVTAPSHGLFQAAAQGPNGSVGTGEPGPNGGEGQGDRRHLPERPGQPSAAARCFAQPAAIPFFPALCGRRRCGPAIGCVRPPAGNSDWLDEPAEAFGGVQQET